MHPTLSKGTNKRVKMQKNILFFAFLSGSTFDQRSVGDENRVKHKKYRLHKLYLQPIFNKVKTAPTFRSFQPNFNQKFFDEKERDGESSQNSIRSS